MKESQWCDFVGQGCVPDPEAMLRRLKEGVPKICV